MLGLKRLQPPYSIRGMESCYDPLEGLLSAPDVEMYRKRRIFGKSETLYQLLRRIAALLWMLIIRIESEPMANRMIDLGMSIDEKFTVARIGGGGGGGGSRQDQMSVYDIISNQKSRHWREWMLTVLNPNRIYGVPGKESTLLCEAFFWDSDKAFRHLMSHGADPHIRISDVSVHQTIRQRIATVKQMVRYQRLIHMPIMVILCTPKSSCVYEALPRELLHCLRTFLY